MSRRLYSSPIIRYGIKLSSPCHSCKQMQIADPKKTIETEYMNLDPTEARRRQTKKRRKTTASTGFLSDKCLDKSSREIGLVIYILFCASRRNLKRDGERDKTCIGRQLSLSPSPRNHSFRHRNKCRQVIPHLQFSNLVYIGGEIQANVRDPSDDVIKVTGF